MRLASAQSTPHPLAGSAFSHFSDQLNSRGSMFSQTSVNPLSSHKHSDFSADPLTKTDINFARCQPEKNSGKYVKTKTVQFKFLLTSFQRLLVINQILARKDSG